MCCSSAGFWFFGVNLRLQFVQYLILRIPCVVVCLTPLRVVFWEPQYGHLNGLPLAIDITSCDTCGGPMYINLCYYQQVTIRIKKKLACLEDQLKISFEDLNIELKKPGIFRESDVFNFAKIDASHSLSAFINHNHFSIINNAAFQVPVQPIPSGINQIELLEKFRAVAEFFPAFTLDIVFSYELNWIHFSHLPLIASPAHNLLGLRKKTKQLNSSLSTRSLMRPENPFHDMLIGQLFETLLPDFVLCLSLYFLYSN